MRLVVVGAGLIGGSVALGARDRGLVQRVTVVELPEAAPTEVVRRVADDWVRSDDHRARRAALAAADLVVLATPVSAIRSALGEALSLAPAVTDCGSTKRWVLTTASSSPHVARFVGGHPMAGAPSNGFARPDLFVGHRWILCPERTDNDVRARVERFVMGLGALIVEMSAGDHDRAVALTSHVPQLLASALRVLAIRRGAELAGGPAFERATFGGGGAKSMWSDIFSTNADEIARALRDLTSELDRVAGALESDRPDTSVALQVLEGARVPGDGQ